MRRAYALLLALLLTVGPATVAQARVPSRPVPGNVAVLVVDDFGLGRNPRAKTGTRTERPASGRPAPTRFHASTTARPTPTAAP